MAPYFTDDWLTVYLGDCREVLATLPAESVHCVVTSPPYWGLRDYGTATWIGGDEACDHAAPKGSERDTCRKCGAVRQDAQLGLEPTPEQYVENMVAVFREVRRVLRSDGTVWLNLGDSYASGGVGRNDTDGANAERRAATYGSGRGSGNGPRSFRTRPKPDSLKPKDLVGIPWRVAFALQADGWYLRSDIIWSKHNPMPESVTDRPTKAHEYVFLLSKSARYWYDADAVREAVEPHNREHNARYVEASKQYGVKMAGTGQRNDSGQAMYATNPAGRNLRSVWTIATQPYPGAHFATFPRKLVEPCIKAGTSEKGVCPECGAPWERVVERGETTGRRDPGGVVGLADAGMYAGRAGSTTFLTTGWQPSCSCEKDGGGWAPVPAVVLDPFAGSGTTALVAQRLSRRAVLIDLNADYLDQVLDRNRAIPLGLGA